VENIPIKQEAGFIFYLSGNYVYAPGTDLSEPRALTSAMHLESTFQNPEHWLLLSTWNLLAVPKFQITDMHLALTSPI
jgi:hypothetical protein